MHQIALFLEIELLEARIKRSRHKNAQLFAVDNNSGIANLPHVRFVQGIHHPKNGTQFTDGHAFRALESHVLRMCRLRRRTPVIAGHVRYDLDFLLDESKDF